MPISSFNSYLITEDSNLRRALAGAIRINIKLAKVYREQKIEIEELNKKSGIIKFHELENTLEALMKGTDALLAKTATKDDFIQQLEAENNLLFHNNETLFGDFFISEQRMEIEQLGAENEQLAKRGSRTAGVTVVTVENDQLLEKNEELFTTITNQEMMIFQAEQEFMTMLKQLIFVLPDVEKLSMEVMDERAEAEAIETQLVSELNFSIQRIGVANELKERLASAENGEREKYNFGVLNLSLPENTRTTITLLEKMHQEVQEHELEIDAWNRDEERMLEQLEATNKRVIELEDEVQHWRMGHYQFVPTESDSDYEEDMCFADDEEDSYFLIIIVCVVNKYF
ncbi:hypothetical protein CAEBREN_13683 [Caenorhabditis brenneri]|uniref:Uncharacterized protein n=1 Tax=Caenorhabditis brenneri TaxID=135651 RepID=G0P3B3_CAEBE|nr:hypothetical protein CAEBREN_13683 [Caenorhabditis brenneri]